MLPRSLSALVALHLSMKDGLQPPLALATSVRLELCSHMPSCTHLCCWVGLRGCSLSALVAVLPTPASVTHSIKLLSHSLYTLSCSAVHSRYVQGSLDGVRAGSQEAKPAAI